MATKWTSPTWRMPEESNQSKFENYSLDYYGSEYVIIGSSTELDNAPSNPYSFSFWFKSSTAGRVLSEKRAVNNFVNAQYAIHLESGYIKWYGGADGATGTQTSNTLIDNQWHHIVCVAESTTVNKIYVDGQLNVTSSANRINGAVVAGTFNIGANYGGSYRFIGQLSQYCIFDYALTSTQISYLYSSDTPQNPMAISGNAPIAYYPLGGSSTGSASTLTIPNESVPSATVFDFTADSKIALPSSVRPTNVMTVSQWLKAPASGHGFSYSIATLGANTGWAGFSMYHASATSLQFQIQTSSTSHLTTAININDNKWHHVVGVYNGSDIRIYLDGLEQGSPTSVSGDISYRESHSNLSVTIGNYPTSNLDFNGLISNTQIWNTNLSTPEITTLYNYGSPLSGTQPQAANLKAWYPMNVDTSNWDGSNWAISDSTANYTKVLSRIASDNTVTSAGSADRVNCGNDSSLQITGSMSISLWFRVNTISPLHSWNFVMGRSRYRTEAAADAVWNLLLKGVSYGNPAFFQFRLSDGTTVTNYEITETTNGDYFNNQWQNLTITYDGTTNVNSIKAYLNGNLHQQFTSSQTGINNVAARNLTFYDNDVYSYGDPAYTGALSNCAIWNSELSASDVTTIWNGGKAADTIPSTNLQGWWKFSDGTYGSPNTYWTFPDSSSNSNTGVTGTYGSAATFFTEDSVKTDYVSALNGTSSGMTTANLVNSDLTRSIPYSSYSMTFGGASRVQLANATGLNFGTGDFTYSLWVNTVNNGNNYFFGNSTDASGNNGTIAFGIHSANDPSWRIWVSGETIDGTLSVSDSWKHCIIRRTSGVINVFVNSVKDTSTGTLARGITNVGNIRIGTFGASEYVNGEISNFAIWDSSLTEDQIITIYNGGVPNDISSLSPTLWYSLGSDSYYNGSSFICPDLSTGSNDGTSTGMGSTALLGIGPGSTGNGTATGMNIPTNLQGNAPNSTKNAFSINMAANDKTSSVPDISS
jgi:hypothetical protein